jgi:hypothetical protein
VRPRLQAGWPTNQPAQLLHDSHQHEVVPEWDDGHVEEGRQADPTLPLRRHVAELLDDLYVLLRARVLLNRRGQQ